MNLPQIIIALNRHIERHNTDPRSHRALARQIRYAIAYITAIRASLARREMMKEAA